MILKTFFTKFHKQKSLKYYETYDFIESKIIVSNLGDITWLLDS